MSLQELGGLLIEPTGKVESSVSKSKYTFYYIMSNLVVGVLLNFLCTLATIIGMFHKNFQPSSWIGYRQPSRASL